MVLTKSNTASYKLMFKPVSYYYYIVIYIITY